MVRLHSRKEIPSGKFSVAKTTLHSQMSVRLSAKPLSKERNNYAHHTFIFNVILKYVYKVNNRNR